MKFIKIAIICAAIPASIYSQIFAGGGYALGASNHLVSTANNTQSLFGGGSVSDVSGVWGFSAGYIFNRNEEHKGFTFTTQYRYLNAGSIEIKGMNGLPGTNQTIDLKMKSSYHEISVLPGLMIPFSKENQSKSTRLLLSVGVAYYSHSSEVSGSDNSDNITSASGDDLNKFSFIGDAKFYVTDGSGGVGLETAFSNKGLYFGAFLHFGK